MLFQAQNTFIIRTLQTIMGRGKKLVASMTVAIVTYTILAAIPVDCISTDVPNHCFDSEDESQLCVEYCSVPTLAKLMIIPA